LAIRRSQAALLALAVTLRTEGKLHEALPLLKEAAGIEGAAVADGGHADPAAAARAQSTHVEVLANYALALTHSGNTNEAVRQYRRAVSIRPDFTNAWISLGDALGTVHSEAAAIEAYRRAVGSDQNHPGAVAGLVHRLAYNCDWRDSAALQRRLEGSVRAELADERRRPALTPFHALTLPFAPTLILQLARAYARNAERSVKLNAVPDFGAQRERARRRAKGKRQKRIRVGYLGCDWGDHPVGRLFAPVPSLHNRSDFEVFCYALNPPDGSAWRVYVEGGGAAACEHWVPLTAINGGMAGAAKRIASDELNVLVDLMGFTGGQFAVARDLIMASRPAPLGVAMLGYPSTTGAAAWEQYMVTDAVITPSESKPHYDEKRLLMPHSYQVNSQALEHQVHANNGRPASAKQLAAAQQQERQAQRQATRASEHLPQDAVVLCDFNSLYKIDAAVLQVWPDVTVLLLTSLLPRVIRLQYSPGTATPTQRTDTCFLRSGRRCCARRLPRCCGCSRCLATLCARSGSRFPPLVLRRTG